MLVMDGKAVFREKSVQPCLNGVFTNTTDPFFLVNIHFTFQYHANGGMTFKINQSKINPLHSTLHHTLHSPTGLKLQ